MKQYGIARTRWYRYTAKLIGAPLLFADRSEKGAAELRLAIANPVAVHYKQDSRPLRAGRTVCDDHPPPALLH